MNPKPDNLGNRLLIALSDTPESMAMVRYVANELDDPANTHIKLMHYLAPIYWEHGGADPGEDRTFIKREEEQIEEMERESDEETEHYFDRASAILEHAGVPHQQIDTTLRYDENSVSEAVLDELKAGAYTGIIMGARHHRELLGLLSNSVTEVLHKHDKNVVMWVVDEE